jgi:GNAT superfamily N-acetyltransferase
MSPSPSTVITSGDQAGAIATVVSAFAADPVERWLYPADDAINGHAAVALWLAPGTEPDAYAVAAVLSETVATEKQEELFAVLGQMGAAHPAEPHWYLPWLAAEPDRQGDGLGARLFAHCLAIVDESGSPASLDTPNPRNVGFYERHGFEVAAVTESPNCPPITSMRRAATDARPER